MSLAAKGTGPFVRTYLWVEIAVEAKMTEEVTRKVKEVSGKEWISDIIVEAGSRSWKSVPNEWEASVFI
jgi:hypothetical protein